MSKSIKELLNERNKVYDELTDEIFKKINYLTKFIEQALEKENHITWSYVASDVVNNAEELVLRFVVDSAEECEFLFFLPFELINVETPDYAYIEKCVYEIIEKYELRQFIADTESEIFDNQDGQPVEQSNFVSLEGFDLENIDQTNMVTPTDNKWKN